MRGRKAEINPRQVIAIDLKHVVAGKFGRTARAALRVGVHTIRRPQKQWPGIPRRCWVIVWERLSKAILEDRALALKSAVMVLREGDIRNHRHEERCLSSALWREQE